MKSIKHRIANLALAGALGAFAASQAQAAMDGFMANPHVDDAWITTRVKSLLLENEPAESLQVKVETHRGTVLLSGWVSTPIQIARAEKMARSVDGVKDIRNDLRVKH